MSTNLNDCSICNHPLGIIPTSTKHAYVETKPFGSGTWQESTVKKLMGPWGNIISFVWRTNLAILPSQLVVAGSPMAKDSFSWPGDL